MSTIIVFMLCLIYAKEKWKIDLCFSYYMKSILSMFVKIRSAILGLIGISTWKYYFIHGFVFRAVIDI